MGDIISFNSFQPIEVVFYNGNNEEIGKHRFHTKLEAYNFLYNNDYEPEDECEEDIFVCIPVPELNRWDDYAIVNELAN